jgi:hypothetical protein
MVNIYHYFFYKLFMFMKKTRNADLSIHGAVIYISIAIFFYLLGLDIFFELYLNLYKIPNGLFEGLLLFIAFIIYYFNNQYFKNADLVNHILDKFKNENKKTKVIGSILVYSTILFSIIFFVLISCFSNK